MELSCGTILLQPEILFLAELTMVFDRRGGVGGRAGGAGAHPQGLLPPPDELAGPLVDVAGGGGGGVGSGDSAGGGGGGLPAVFATKRGALHGDLPSDGGGGGGGGGGVHHGDDDHGGGASVGPGAADGEEPGAAEGGVLPAEEQGVDSAAEARRLLRAGGLPSFHSHPRRKLVMVRVTASLSPGDASSL